ncbi:MAG: methyltransferase domain-containing protein [Methylovulum sp.]|nr:methyltransferase domain-containing protein [Methylovulum sp.]
MWLSAFQPLLTAYTGLTIAPSDYDKAVRFLQHRVAELRLFDLSSYLGLLETQSLAADQEWQHIVQVLTVPESFFLRDKGQMQILKEHILPELIQRNHHSRQLRLWSAGCSTGEEPYSLALLLQQLLPDIHDWDVLILGTDINDKVLAKARAGLYTRWSLRDVGPEVLAYFHPAAHGQLALDASIRDRVSFRRTNLLQTPFPDFEINDIDLILCRNVFIYFDQQAIATVLAKFTQTLKPEGYLLTGHGELYQQALNGLETRLFLESVVYQRIANKRAALPPLLLPVIEAIAPMVSTKTVTDSTAPKSATVALPLTASARMKQAYLQEDYAAVLAIAQTQPSQGTDFETYYWSAKAFACIGQYHAAETRLQDALALKPRSVSCHYLLAHVKESQNDLENAKALLQKTILLDETFVPAYLDLAALCEHEEPDKYQQLHTQALTCLKQLPPEHYFEDIAAHAGDLIHLLPS